MWSQLPGEEDGGAELRSTMADVAKQLVTDTLVTHHIEVLRGDMSRVAGSERHDVWHTDHISVYWPG